MWVQHQAYLGHKELLLAVPEEPKCALGLIKQRARLVIVSYTHL
jgi:hypothetical protein